MAKPTSTLNKSYALLNEAHQAYTEVTSEESRSFFALKLQICIFHYETCQEMVSFLRNKHEGFAGKVALKRLLHLLWEYENAFGPLLKDIRDLAEKSSRTFSEAELRAERKTWSSQLSQLRGWTQIRNKATGHFDKDRHLQFSLIDSIDPEAVMTASLAVLSFNSKILLILRQLGDA